MDTVADVIERYNRHLSAAQKRNLKKKALALSLMNAQKRMDLVQKDTARIQKTNALLTDYGLATSLYAAPVSGTDAAARRMSAAFTGERTLAQTEQAELYKTANRMRRENEQKREEEKRKKARKTTPAQQPETGLPGRTVVVKKL